ncbi:hypothetical protein [Glutamicibacter arilaitensis]|uniref:hypothetical protein n=1 Tax=Glutamicibacter arilaitensis TaxID=256701 RepID=UPI0038503E4D
MKRNSEPRTAGDGSHKTPVYYENRLVTINGRLFTKNHEYLHQAEGILNALGHRGGAKLLVEGHGPTQWATVDPRGTPEFTAVTGTFLQFQIPLEAIDPFKYGESYEITGSGSSYPSLFHRGTVPAWPVVTVTGSGSYTLNINGLVSVTQPLVSGVAHTIDYRTGILRAGGSVVRGGFSTANFQPIKPGLAQTMWITGNANVTVRYNDTYI